MKSSKSMLINTVSFETPIVHLSISLKLPTDLVSVIIQAKYMISISKLS